MAHFNKCSHNADIALVVNQFKRQVDVTEMALQAVEAFNPVIGETAAPDNVVTAAERKGDLNPITLAGYIDLGLC